jgi:hypothetical protein
MFNMKELKEIIIGQGIGSIIFGMTKDELKEVAGKPDETEQYNYDDSEEFNAESWHYDSLELSVAFEEENDWKLSNIAVSSPGYLFNGKKLIGLTKDEVVKEIKGMELGTLEVEDCSSDDDPNLSVISFDESALNLWFDEGILTEIQWGILWEEDDDAN